jgi:hypothetical protein
MAPSDLPDQREDTMENRLNSAYASLKFSQQVLVTLMATDLPQPVKDKISDVLAELTHAQDALIVLRESLQRVEFDHAALRAGLRGQDVAGDYEGARPHAASREARRPVP